MDDERAVARDRDTSDHLSCLGGDDSGRLLEGRYLSCNPYQRNDSGSLLWFRLPGIGDSHLARFGAFTDSDRSHGAARGTERRRSDALRLAMLAAAPTVPALILGAIFSARMMEIVFGPSYAVAGPTLFVLLASAIPGAVVLVLAPLASVGNRGRYAWVTLGGLVANIAINLILIPIAGPLGAAWANLISQVMIAMALLTRWVLLPNESPLSVRKSPDTTINGTMV